MKPHRIILFALAIGLFVFAVSSCETPYQRERVLRSVYVEYGFGDGNQDRNGKRSWDEDTSYIAVGFHPFAGFGSPDRVVVVPQCVQEECGPPCVKPK